MPITNTGSAAETAMTDAENAARTAFMADKQNRALTPEELAQLKSSIRTAGLNALFAHLVANASISVSTSVTVGGTAPGPSFPSAVTASGSGSGTGTLT